MLGKKILPGLLALYVILGSWQGYLAIYDRGAAEPKQIFPKEIASLPEQDQRDLIEGIIVRNDRDLQRKLEELLS